MSLPAPENSPEKPNPARDSWRPSEKAEEAAIDNPEEFDRSATEDSSGPVPDETPRTHGEALDRK